MHTPRILVVDENAAIAQLEHAMFELHRYNVDVTIDPDEALRRLRVRTYDVIVAGAPMRAGARYFLDLVTVECPSMIRSTIVVTTQVHDGQLMARCDRAGVFAVVAKPFDVAQLGDVVARCIASRTDATAPTQFIGIAPVALMAIQPRK